MNGQHRMKVCAFKEKERDMSKKKQKGREKKYGRLVG